MKKLFAVILISMLFLPAGKYFADTENISHYINYKPTLMEKIENSTGIRP